STMRDTERRGVLMPDETVEFPFTAVGGNWGSVVPSGPGVLRLEPHALRVLAGDALVLELPYPALSGAAWQAGCLTMLGAPGRILWRADRGLERAWAGLLARACRVPEFARGLRTLGSPRARVNRETETRFFAPLLQARRRVEDEGEPDQRVAAFAARLVAERLQQLIAALATEAYPESAPDRRALEAELLEATEALFARLEEVDEAAERFRQAPDESRFEHWRTWTARVAAAFAEADRSWVVIAGLLP